MDIMQKAKRTAELVEIIEVLEERKKRVKELNHYDHEASDNPRPMFIEFGGGGVHTKMTIRGNAIGDNIETFFCNMFDEGVEKAQAELATLIKEPILGETHEEESKKESR